MVPKLPRFTPLPPESQHTPAPVETPQPYSPRSHVTHLPSEIEGHNFNPQARAQNSQEPNVVHITRPLEPKTNDISDELRQKHESSAKQYPFLNLSEGEFVVLNIQRHIIGLLIPIGGAALLVTVLLSLLVLYPVFMASSTMATSGLLPGFGLMALIILLLCGLIGIYAYVAVWIYLRNQLFLTNESVIQELQYSLFSHHEQTASLGSVEDVSYKKHGIWQTIFDYGSIRLSTEGEETTYRFYYVSNPKKQTAILTNAVEAYKNGRPVTGV